MWRTFVCGVAMLGACSEPEPAPAPPTEQDTPPTAPDNEEPPPTEAAPGPSEAPTPPASEGPPEGDIPSCTWYADRREPMSEGPRSLAAFDRALTEAQGEETWVLGRVRGRARDCPDVSVGLAIRSGGRSLRPCRGLTVGRIDRGSGLPEERQENCLELGNRMTKLVSRFFVYNNTDGYFLA